MSFEVSGARELAADLERAAWRAIPAVAKVVAKGARDIKNQLREDAKSSGSYKHFAGSISFDLRRGGLEAEIGPDKAGPQGALGNILYFGTSKNGPVLSLDAPLAAEEPRFMRAIEDVADGLPR